MAKESFDRKLSETESLRTVPEEAAIPALAKALKDRNNFLVAKAAGIAGDRLFAALEPDLLTAFERFLRDPVKTDPQCWAKAAIAKALKDLSHTDPAVFLRGIEHFQYEPVYGGRADTAPTLRATCAHALVSCRLEAFAVLTRLTDLLCDPALPVRSDAARAIAQLDATEGSLPLRLKALVGDTEPEVIGHCFAALLSLSTAEHLAFVIGFLNHHDPDTRIEAASVLAESHAPEALSAVIDFFRRQADPNVKRTLLAFIAASPQPVSADFLRSLDTPDARDALLKSRHAQREAVEREPSKRGE